MDFAFTEEQEMLRASVAGFLEDKVPMSRVRELMEGETGFDPATWAEMSAMGLPALAIPEEYGGAGFTQLELGVVLEETGRRLTPSPLLGTAVLGANLLLLAGNDDQKLAHLPAVAAGRRHWRWRSSTGEGDGTPRPSPPRPGLKATGSSSTAPSRTSSTGTPPTW